MARHEWTGTDLPAYFTKIPDGLVAPSIASLRAWLDEHYPDDGVVLEPTDRLHRIRTADELGDASYGRRESCMATLDVWVRILRGIAAKEADPSRSILAKMGRRAVVKTVEMLGYTLIDVRDGFAWQDDGKDDVLKEGLSASFGPVPRIGSIDVSVARELTEQEASEVPGHRF